jgi:glyoxylase-like metal-dependent hydrolase (beta-lactamase superfamily II)
VPNSLILSVAAVPPFMKNGFVLGCPDTREGVIVDPGDEVDELLEAAVQHALSIKYILLTHAHLDHITGVDRAKAAFGAPVVLHRADEFLYKAVLQQGMAFGIPARPQPPIDEYFDGPGPWRFGHYGAWVSHTPGHAPGGVCLAIGRDDDPKRVLIVGDTLFAGSIGRTDLPGGDLETLLHAIRTVLFAFPDDTLVWPGHGPETTVGQERRMNPYLQ